LDISNPPRGVKITKQRWHFEWLLKSAFDYVIQVFLFQKHTIINYSFDPAIFIKEINNLFW
jgi:hypothetical protein